MAAKKDSIFDALNSWRTERPDEPFARELEDLRAALPTELARHNLNQIRHWLADCEGRMAALESEYPYLRNVYLPAFERPEEQEYALCELFIPRLKLEVARRGQRAESDLGGEAIHSPEAEQQGSIARAGSEGDGKWYDTEPDVLRRRQIVLKNPGLPAIGLCKVFDGTTPPIPLPRDWRAELGVKTWREAYENTRARNRVQKIISTDKRTEKRPGRP